MFTLQHQAGAEQPERQQDIRFAVAVSVSGFQRVPAEWKSCASWSTAAFQGSYRDCVTRDLLHRFVNTICADVLPESVHTAHWQHWTSWGTTTTILLHACAGWRQYARAGVHDDLVPTPLAYWTLCHAEQIDGGRHITPQLLVVDFSFVLTHCLMFTFNQCSLTQYTNAAWKFAKHETSTFPLTPDALICRGVFARDLHTRTAVARLRNR